MPQHTSPDKPGTIQEGKPATVTSANEADSAYADGPALPRTNKVVLVMDLVESVRLMAQDESGVVARWHGFTKKASKLIPRHRGRIVKSLGDGLLAEFDHSRDAVQAATALHKMIHPANQGRGQDQQLWLRVGINATPVYVDAIDIYGSGVNLAARLAGLAGPGETITSASVRDQLTDGLDADVEDMGECYLKHVDEPVRAYRVGPPGPRPVLVPEKEYNTPLQPTIAVIPFTSRSNTPEHFAIGELIADGVIGKLARYPHAKVVARLSTTALRDRHSDAQAISALNADYYLCGTYLMSGNDANAKLICQAELCDSREHRILWTERIQGKVGDLFDEDCQLTQALCQGLTHALVEKQVDMVAVQPMPSLRGYTIMLGGVTLMHRASLVEFDRARMLLEHLCEQYKKRADPHAWLAKWHVLRFVRMQVSNREQEAALAVAAVHRALEINPSSSLALAMKGHVECQVLGDLGAAQISLEHALQVNAHDSLAWLFKSVVSTENEQHSTALFECAKANRLSPLDPLGYLYNLIHASAQLASNNPEQAIRLAEKSLRQNCHQAPTLRVLLTAQVESNQIQAGKQTLQRLQRETPGLTVQRYLGAAKKISRPRLQCANALRVLGLPEH